MTPQLQMSLIEIDQAINDFKLKQDRYICYEELPTLKT